MAPATSKTLRDCPTPTSLFGILPSARLVCIACARQPIYQRSAAAHGFEHALKVSICYLGWAGEFPVAGPISREFIGLAARVEGDGSVGCSARIIDDKDHPIYFGSVTPKVMEIKC